MIWRVTAGCLWLGNIDFSGDVDEVDVDKTGISGEALKTVADLWQVDVDKLETACHTETLTLAKKLTVCPRNLTTSRNLRDSIARAVYDGLFVWMIEHMSEVLSTRTGRMNAQQPFIGVLDIFGFEFYTDETLIPLGGQATGPSPHTPAHAPAHTPSHTHFQYHYAWYCDEIEGLQHLKNCSSHAGCLPGCLPSWF